MCLLIIQWQCQRNDRCQTGRGPVILVLRFNREFAFEEILMLLCLLQLLPFPSLPPSYFFSLPFRHFSLFPAPSLPLLNSVSAPTAMVSAAQKAEERKRPRMLVEAPERGVTCRGSIPGIVLGVFSLPWGCQTWHDPFLVTIQLVFRFSKNSSISPHVTGCTCASLFY